MFTNEELNVMSQCLVLQAKHPKVDSNMMKFILNLNDKILKMAQPKEEPKQESVKEDPKGKEKK